MPYAMTQPFIDRRETGRLLGQQLRHYSCRSDVMVLALPRGGVPVAYEGATVLDVRLDEVVVRRLGVAGQPEIAMGAIAVSGIRVLNQDVIRYFAVPRRTVDVLPQAEERELARLTAQPGESQRSLNPRGQTVILVDESLASGASMQEAVLAARQLAPIRIVVAAPVGAVNVCRARQALAAMRR